MTDLDRLLFLESKRFSFDEDDKQEHQSLYAKIQQTIFDLNRVDDLLASANIENLELYIVKFNQLKEKELQFDELRRTLTDVQSELTYLQELNNGVNYSCEQFSLENKKLKEMYFHKEKLTPYVDDGKSDIL